MKAKKKIDLLRVSAESEAFEAHLTAPPGEKREGLFPKTAFAAAGNVTSMYKRIHVPGDQES